MVTITGAGATASVIDATGLGDRVLSVAAGAPSAGEVIVICGVANSKAPMSHALPCKGTVANGQPVDTSAASWRHS
jgi:hypothetical protein